MMVDRKLTREEFRELMKDAKWHRINSDQLWEISRVIAWMVEYKPGAEWMKHFECMMDNLIKAMRLAADKEGENEQIEKG